MEVKEDLEFKGNDPGAVRFGNFINYYSFYPPHERIKHMPQNIWKTEGISYCLDIGCNTGVCFKIINQISLFYHISFQDLTEAFNKFLLENGNENRIIGIDIDPMLIERAKAQYNNYLEFFCIDIMSTVGYDFIKTFLNNLNLKKFQIVTCFSISMWIHLNHGDAGLITFLERVSELSELLVIEAQPWKCYRNAVKRMKKSENSFPHFKNLKMRGNVVKDLENIIINKCKRIKIHETADTKWGRKTLFFR